MTDTTLEFTADGIPSTTLIDLSSSVDASLAEIERLEIELAQMAALTDLIGRIDTAADQGAACQTLVDQLQEYLCVDQVFVGLCGDDSPACRLTSISNTTAFHSRDEYPLAAQAVLQEVIARGEPACWPALEEASAGGLLAHRQFAEANHVAAMVSSPLRDASGQLRGAWLVVGSADRVLDAKVSSFLHAAESSVASALHLVARAEEGPLQQIWSQVRRTWRAKRTRTNLTIMALLTMVMCLPLRYRPNCDCTVEPVPRRYIAVPFNGPLKEVLVEPGDKVEAGQLLARMDGREIRWELAGTLAELHRAEKQRTGHLAAHDSGKAEVARFEVEQLKIRTELLEHRNLNLQINSPIAGVVVSGDLEEAEGMPLETGQTLFEIAPLAEMRIDVAIAQDNFAHVRVGMPATVRLDAYPMRTFETTIERIHPRADLQDGENVFMAEVRLANSDGALSPGMRGTARIEGEQHTLAWILLHRPYAAAIAWLGW